MRFCISAFIVSFTLSVPVFAQSNYMPWQLQQSAPGINVNLNAGYSTIPAAQFVPDVQVRKVIASSFPYIRQMELDAVKNPSSYNGNLAALPRNAPVLPFGVPHSIMLDSISTYGNGTVGWANSNPGFAGNIAYGRIYIYGITIPGLASWVGTVYPTNKTIGYFHWTLPCFTTNAYEAIQLNNQTW